MSCAVAAAIATLPMSLSRSPAAHSVLHASALAAHVSRVASAAMNRTATLQPPAAALSNFDNAIWTINASVGTPGVVFRLAIDTASGNWWLPTAACTDYVASPPCQFQTKYDASKSSSYVPCTSNCDFSCPLSDGNSTLVGTMAKETLALIPGINVVNAPLAMLSAEPLPYLDGQAYDGIIGVAFNGSACPLFSQTQSVITVASETGAIGAPMFSLYIDPKQTPGAPGASVMTLGCGSSAFAGGPYTTAYPAPIWQALLGLWAVTMDYIYFNGIITPACDGCIAVFDSSSPFIFGPPAMMQQIISLVGPVDPSCANLPTANVSFAFNGTQFALGPAQYVLRLPQSIFNSTIVCTSAFQDYDVSGGLLNIWVLGTPFMRAFYTVYDMTTAQVQIAIAASNSN